MRTIEQKSNSKNKRSNLINKKSRYARRSKEEESALEVQSGRETHRQAVGGGITVPNTAPPPPC